MRNAKKDDIDKFISDRKIKYLGMPIYIGSGSEDIDSMKHRFLVMPRYGRDIYKIFEDHNRKFPLHTVYRIGWQLTNILEYIHTCTYVHMDLKGANIMLGFGKNGEEQVHLLDYGLACHYSTKEYKNDPKKAHNGTIEYTSRDAHNGVATMRGDIEILGYNLIEWAGGKLPWTASQAVLQKPVEVQKMKESFMKTVDKSLKACFTSTIPSPISAFMKYLESMKHDTVPDYKKIRGFFEAGLKELKKPNAGKLEFATAANDNNSKPTTSKAGTSKPVSSPLKRPAADARKKNAKVPKVTLRDLDSDEEEEEKKETSATAMPTRRNARDQPKRYAEVESDEDMFPDVKVTKPSSPKKKKDNPKATEKNENKNVNEAESPQKKSKSEKPAEVNVGQVFLKSKSGKSSKKTVQLNFDLNISFDSDLVVTVNRKDKNKAKDDKGADEKNKDEAKAGYYKGKFAK
jgi:vaccinia related kinase